jgi:hypothetical protein
MGRRNSGGRAGRSIGGTGRSGLAGGPCEDLSRPMYVRTSLTFEYVRVFGVFRTGYLKRVPDDVVVVQESIGGY